MSLQRNQGLSHCSPKTRYKEINLILHTRPENGYPMIVWAAISHQSRSPLVFIERKMNF